MDRRIGCAVGVLRDGPATGRLALLGEIGIACIEPQFDKDAEDAEDATFMRETQQNVAATGLQVWSCHTPFGPEVEISSLQEHVRERGITAAIRTARGCRELGGKLIVVHCGEHHDDEPSRRDALRRAPESVSRIVDACAPLGVRVALENLPPGYVTSSAEELMTVVEQFPPERVGVCLDTGHAHIAGDLIELVRAVADRIITTHIHDNDRSCDQHYVPGSGTINWETVGAELGRSPYFSAVEDDGEAAPIMFEVSGPGTHAEAISRLPGAAEMIGRFILSGAGATRKDGAE